MSLNLILETIKKLSSHKYVILTSRGNSAIYIALSLAKKFSKGSILIPDQAGWLTYKQYSKKLKLGASELRTDYGVIQLNELKSKLKEASALICQNARRNLQAFFPDKSHHKSKNYGAIIYQNPAGYFAEQPSKEIYSLCKGKCTVICDVTGAVGTSMCNGNSVDIMVCSFGKWKPINLGYGGFISFNDKAYLEFTKKLMEEKPNLSFDDSSGRYSQLLNKLNTLNKKQKLFSEINKKIKNDLKGFEIIHKDKRGVNVIVKFNDEAEKEKIIKYCSTNNYDFVLCPRYIRVNEKAVSIEVKRLG
ncbi:hypothetical protein CMO89_01010 [Candidatus Woesearchaeota archaeon]|nr:hypothetical protein [Candidatus Woesearchaeota archaeon]|tara:strand:+ start:10379 stop:11290 length:912 start_codon:yes stop_codon:yes gene_type:complete